MKSTPWIPAFAGMTTGVLYALAFPPYNLDLLAWLCLVPLLRAPVNRKSAFFVGCLAGFVANLIIFSWLWATFHSANINWITTLGVWALLALVLSIYFGVFLLLYTLVPNHWSKPWIAGALWTLLDQVKSISLTGFPWALLSHTQVHNLPFLQLASLTGAHGLTFLLVAFNAALAQRKSRPFKTVLPVAAAVVIVHLWGWQRLVSSRALLAEAPQVKVAALQGNIDQYQKWDTSYEELVRQRYEALAETAAKQKPDVIIWPESAVPGWIPNEKYYVAWLENVVSKTGCINVVGAVTTRRGNDYNAAFLMDSNGKLGTEYDKQHLVPFGEYVPFGDFAKRWIPYLGQIGVFAAGKSPKLFSVGDLRVSPNICYEAIFPELVRQSVKAGADLIINITNDGWFLTTGAPEQHYNANILRAVENARPVVRAANTGISAVIDPFGRELARTNLMETTALVQDVPVLSPPQITLFSRCGSWFLYLCLALVIGSWAVTKVTD